MVLSQEETHPKFRRCGLWQGFVSIKHAKGKDQEEFNGIRWLKQQHSSRAFLQMLSDKFNSILRHFWI